MFEWGLYMWYKYNFVYFSIYIQNVSNPALSFSPIKANVLPQKIEAALKLNPIKKLTPGVI